MKVFNFTPAEARLAAALANGTTIDDAADLLSICSDTARHQLSKAQSRRVMDYIHANLDCELSLIDLAKLVQYSPRQFFRIFSNTFGTTPHQYVMNERVARAKELLSEGQLLVEIAAVLGFASQSHFSEVFRKTTGMSPGRFRREHRC